MYVTNSTTPAPSKKPAKSYPGSLLLPHAIKHGTKKISGDGRQFAVMGIGAGRKESAFRALLG
jgi:hypothetical protein